MATLKLVKKSTSKNNCIFIPGGPGLGPISFMPITELINTANIYHYFPSGTDNKEIIDQDLSYKSQLQDLRKEIQKIDNPVIIGHSFGGILASDLVVQTPTLLKSLICIATPFSENVFKTSSEVFNNIKSEERILIDKMFKENPSNENFKDWFSFYGDLYFTKINVNAGKKMIIEDSACAKSYLAARSEAAQKESLLKEINKTKKDKLFILGREDKILPFDLLLKDAEAGNFNKIIIEDAGHFVHFDQPMKVADTISNFIQEQGR
jgi:pimeloyl-ACP methyl ester carboxylesterase